MSREFPSMTALLGLLAIAGYQNRDKIAEMLRGGEATGQAGAPGQVSESHGQSGGGLGGLLGGLLGGSGGSSGGLGSLLGGAAAGGTAGGLLSGGLGELLNRFQQTGMGDAASSWVSQGPNREITEDELERSLGPDVIDTLTQRTGLSREDLLSRLSRDLPRTVDSLTPEGRLPQG